MFFQRDEPGFLVKYTEAMGFILSVRVFLWGAMLAGQLWLLQKKKDRADRYYMEIQGIITEVHGHPTKGRLKELENQLRAVEKYIKGT